MGTEPRSYTQRKTTRVETPLRCMQAMRNSEVWSVVARGLFPLLMMIVIAAVAAALLVLIRLLVDPVRYFLIQKGLFIGVMLVGLAFMSITYIITTRRTLKRIDAWRASGQMEKVMVATVLLMVVAFMLVSPLLLALLLHVGV